MTIQIVNISYHDVFKRYGGKYNIFRDLYEKDLLGLEIRNIEQELSEKVRRIFLDNKEICYSVKNENNCSDFLALGSFSVLKDLSKIVLSAGNEDLGYKISKVFGNIRNYDQKYFKIDSLIYPLTNSYVMGILNVTPDSFSDGGKYFNTDDAVRHAIEMIDEGADFIDIGGESTRPGSEKVETDEELRRVIPVIEKLISKRPGAIISIDTTKSAVAKEALNSGAKIVNDISGGTFDKNILNVVSEFKAAMVIMHIKGTPKVMQNNPFYEDVVSEVYDFLSEKAEEAEKYGIKNLFIDPGIGFGKRVEDNFELVKRLNEFKSIGYPILIGMSRKSFLGKTLGNNIDERENATTVAETIAVNNGARIVRTHNVKNAAEAKKIINFVNNPEKFFND